MNWRDAKLMLIHASKCCTIFLVWPNSTETSICEKCWLVYWYPSWICRIYIILRIVLALKSYIFHHKDCCLQSDVGNSLKLGTKVWHGKQNWKPSIAKKIADNIRIYIHMKVYMLFLCQHWKAIISPLEFRTVHT